MTSGRLYRPRSNTYKCSILAISTARRRNNGAHSATKKRESGGRMIINTGARTDTVQWYTPWLLKRFEEGYALARNPLFPNKVTRYELDPALVDVVEFCSKNYAPLPAASPHDNRPVQHAFPVHHHCVRPQTSNRAFLRSTTPSRRCTNSRESSEPSASAGATTPVLLTRNYSIERHFETFDYLCGKLVGHVDRCIFSFVEIYRKLRIQHAPSSSS